jgi:hypothetical protein
MEVLIPENLKPFGINTYKKYGGEGILLLTRHPRKGVCPERPSGVKDLSRYPMRIAVLPAPSFSGSERSKSIRDSDSVGKDPSSSAPQREG